MNRQKWHTIEVVVDRLVVDDGADANRFADSVEQAINLGNGVVQVSVVDGEELVFSERFALRPLRRELGRDRASHILLQQPPRRLPHLHRPGLQAGA